jgi:hypothetical protein
MRKRLENEGLRRAPPPESPLAEPSLYQPLRRFAAALAAQGKQGKKMHELRALLVASCPPTSCINAKVSLKETSMAGDGLKMNSRLSMRDRKCTWSITCSKLWATVEGAFSFPTCFSQA